ncbi:hypothetical protein SpCBS45565_g06767 [Spizellomyces sp. 'palustris']|nr:hypothetical protein SpCBS45565_g06767 [Spizellomyces sp. 'palustris']
MTTMQPTSTTEAQVGTLPPKAVECGQGSQDSVKSKKSKKPKTPQEPTWKTKGEDGTVFVTEGKATIKFPSDNSVFYNPVQEYNRDTSIAAISTWSKMFFKERVETAGRRRKVKQPSGRENGDGNERNEPTSPQKSAIPAIFNGYIEEHEEIKMEDLDDIDLSQPEYKDQRFTILEALSATGLRSIRYAKDLEHVETIVANDILSDAVEAIRQNVKHNNVEDIVVANEGDANISMYQVIKKPYDVIDLDPYGSAAPFLDAAVQAVSEGGLLCITCTDLAVLAGNQPDACWAKYGGMPLPNSPYCHEMALRLLLHTVQTSAARYKRCIEPLLSLSIDFYVRIFVRVYTSPALVKKAAGKTSMVYHCSGCRSFVLQPIGKSPQNGDGKKVGAACGPNVGSTCEHCGRRFHIGGPFYSAPIHNQEFIKRMLRHVTDAPQEKYKTKSRMIGMLTVASEELPIPFFYDIASLVATAKSMPLPLLKFTSALLNMGYKVSLTHAAQNCVKTNAPGWAVWDVIRRHVQEQPLKERPADTPGSNILAKPLKNEVSWEHHPQANPCSRKMKLVRYQENPTAYWGPMERAGSKKAQEANGTNKKRSGDIDQLGADQQPNEQTADDSANKRLRST